MAIAVGFGIQAAVPSTAAALDNGLAKTPPMGISIDDLPFASYVDDSACPPDPYQDTIHCQIPVTSHYLLAQAKALVRPVTRDGRALADLGYDTIQLDYGWIGPRNGPVDPLTGQQTLAPNPHRWPGGVPEWERTVHEITHDLVTPKYHRHIKLGIYEDPGAATECQVSDAWAYWSTNNGLYQHEVTDARTFARWGISAIRLDGAGCGNGYMGFDNMPDGQDAELAKIDKVFAKWAPHITITINNASGPNWPCQPVCSSFPNPDQALLGYMSYDVPAPKYTNMWSIGLDDCGCFDYQLNYSTGVLEAFDIAVADKAWKDVHPGSYPSFVELLPSGGEGIGWTSSGYGCCGTFPGANYKNWLTPREQQTEFGLYSLLSSGLFIAKWLPDVQNDPHALGFLTNKAVIDVDQDPRGDMARIVDGPIVPPKTTIQSPGPPTGTYQVLSKVLAAPGERAVGLLNRTDAPRSITMRFSDLRCDDGHAGGLTHVTRVEDLWTHHTVPASEWRKTGSYTVTVPGHGIALFKVWGRSAC